MPAQVERALAPGRARARQSGAWQFRVRRAGARQSGARQFRAWRLSPWLHACGWRGSGILAAESPCGP